MIFFREKLSLSITGFPLRAFRNINRRNHVLAGGSADLVHHLGCELLHPVCLHRLRGQALPGQAQGHGHDLNLRPLHLPGRGHLHPAHEQCPVPAGTGLCPLPLLRSDRTVRADPGQGRRRRPGGQ